MDTKIKIDLAARLKDHEAVSIELGCGRHKRAGCIGVDSVDLPEVDIVSDLEAGLAFLPDNSVDEIHCRSVLEHIRNFEGLVGEMVRVLKPTGLAHVYVPHFSNPYYYSDPTHVRFFGLYSFYYFVDESEQVGRVVPSYYTDIRLRIVSQKLVFRSSFALRKPLKKLFGRFINLHPWLQRYYEEALCYACPCDGIEVTFQPVS